MLSTKETDQYQRHLSLPGFGVEGQLKLKKSSVLVIGAGGLGCPVLQYLVGAGVGKIGIVDDDLVDISNLQRQVLFNHDDIGNSKAKVAKLKLSLLNPNIEIIDYPNRFNSSNAENLLRGFDIVVDGTDNFSTRYLINDACVICNKILVYGAIFKFEGQVSVFNFNNGPTYRCLFPSPPSAKALPSCSEIGVLGVLPGIIGNLQALEVIKVLTGIGDPLSGRVLLYDALTQQTRMLKLNPTKDGLAVTSLKEISLPCETNQNDMREQIIKEISPQELVSIMEDRNEVFLLDVREGWERAKSKISPSFHVPLGEFESSQRPVLPDSLSENKKIIVYCKAGVRSRLACQSLREHGFKELHNLSGGILEWESKGFPVS
jgi:adenylyltransferase/sulfurtransferase